IEGAVDGAGIGDRFLGHIERCRVLLHLVDSAADDPVEGYQVVREELAAYGAGLAEKPQVIALNKIDAIDPDDAADLRAQIAEESESEVLLLSGATRTGLETVLDRLIDALGPAEGGGADEG